MHESAKNTGIPCVSCGSTASEVMRTTTAAGYITRRRECVECKCRFTTVERIVGTELPATATGSGQFTFAIGQIAESLKLLENLSPKPADGR